MENTNGENENLETANVEASTDQETPNFDNLEYKEPNLPQGEQLEDVEQDLSEQYEIKAVFLTKKDGFDLEIWVQFAINYGVLLNIFEEYKVAEPKEGVEKVNFETANEFIEDFIKRQVESMKKQFSFNDDVFHKITLQYKNEFNDEEVSANVDERVEEENKESLEEVKETTQE